MTKIGIDLGGVIADTHKGPHMYEETHHRIQPVKGAITGVRTLVKRYTSNNIFIISKAQPTTQLHARDFLQRVAFFKKTGFNPNNLFFCLKREDKTPIAKNLGLTHFIDDRHEILVFLEKVVTHCFLFGPQQTKTICPNCIYTPGWKDVIDKFA